MPIEGRRRLVCYHEADHAVVRWWLGHINDNAVVLTMAEVRSGARLVDRRGRPHAAEGMVNGYDLLEHGDRKGALREREAGDDGLWRLCEARVRMAVVELYAGGFAEARFRRASVSWCFVEGGGGDLENARRVTAEWFDDEAEARAALGQAERIARAFMRSPKAWAAISAVAAALHERGEVGGVEIASLCAEAYGGEPAHDAWALRWPPTPDEIRSGFLPRR